MEGTTAITAVAAATAAARSARMTRCDLCRMTGVPKREEEALTERGFHTALALRQTVFLVGNGTRRKGHVGGFLADLALRLKVYWLWEMHFQSGRGKDISWLRFLDFGQRNGRSFLIGHCRAERKGFRAYSFLSFQCQAERNGIRAQVQFLIGR